MRSLRWPVPRSFLLILALMVCACVPLGAQPPEPPPDGGQSSIDLPETPQREEEPPWRLPPGYELPADESDPLRVWLKGLQDVSQVIRKTTELDNEQARLVGEVQMHQREIQKRSGTFPPFRDRSRMRELIVQLHANQDALQEANKELMRIVGRLAKQAGPIRTSLQSVQERWAALAEKSRTDDTHKNRREAAMAGRERDRLTATLTILEELEADPTHKAARLLTDIRRHFNGKAGRSRGYVLQRLTERLERLEREQKLLRQSLEAADEELTTVRRQLERIEQMQMRRAWRPSSGQTNMGRPSGPPPSEGGDSTESSQPRRRPRM